MHNGFHGLIGTPADLLLGLAERELKRLLRRGPSDTRLQPLAQGADIRLVAAQRRPARLGLGGVYNLGHRLLVHPGVRRENGEGLAQVLNQQAAVCLFHALGERIVKVRNALAAVLVVLVGLDGNAGQRRIALYVLRLAQIAVAGIEAVGEQPVDIDLAAGRRQRVKVKVVYVNPALLIGARLFGREQIGCVIGLGRGAAELQHAAHGGVAVHIRIVALEVRAARVGVGDFVARLHERGV